MTHPNWVVISSCMSRWWQWWMTSHLSFTCIFLAVPLKRRNTELYRTVLSQGHTCRLVFSFAILTSPTDWPITQAKPISRQQVDIYENTAHFIFKYLNVLSFVSYIQTIIIRQDVCQINRWKLRDFYKNILIHT